MRAFRIALAAHALSARDAFSGLSGFHTDGRWHTSGRFLDYTAEHLSLATLERLVHYKRFDALAPHNSYALEIPDRFIADLPTIPAGWDADDAFSVPAQNLGNAWHDRKTSPALRVPSAATKGEFNLLVNTRHPDWDWAWVTAGPIPFDFRGAISELIAKARVSDARRTRGRSRRKS